MIEKIDDLDNRAKDEILQAARECYPNEMCGFVVQLAISHKFVLCENVADNPQQTFDISADDFIRANAMGEILAVVHSHPNGEPFLSGADRQCQMGVCLPWILAVSGSLKVFRPVPHLRGREFVYDDADCCRLIQDAYHLCGLDLPDCPRVDIDTDIKQQTILRYFEQSDVFERVHGLQAGDVILTQSSNNTPEHALLYLSNGEMLHHANGHLSRREPYHSYWQKCTHSVWRHRDFKADMMTAIFNDLIHSE